MSRNGRAEDQHFENDELLFRRYLREHFVGDRLIDGISRFRFRLIGKT